MTVIGVIAIGSNQPPLINEKSVLNASPTTVAYTRYSPNSLFAVNDGAVTTPNPSVNLVVVVLFVSAKVPDAPLSGTENSTWTSEIGLPLLSRTIAFNGSVKAWFGYVYCPLPPAAKMTAVEPILAVYSYEPMSQVTPCGRGKSRQSTVPVQVPSPAFTAGLVERMG